MLLRIAAAVALAAVSAAPARADACRLELGTRGTFHEVSAGAARCLTFVDVLGNTYEVVNPKGAYRDGLSGVVFAQWEPSGTCTEATPIRVCSFDGDFTRRVTAELVFRNFIECPGFVLATTTQDYRIYNCEDFGTELCDLANLGRRVHAQLTVEEGISICLGQAKSFVIDWRFLD